VSIGDTLFQGYLSLKSICIPSSVEEIGADIFGECAPVPKVTFEPGSKYLAKHDNPFET
jgi:hypothetical protein